MLDHPTLDLLHELGLQGMAHGFRELAQNPEAGNLQHGEGLAILLEHEATLRRQKRFEARARTAGCATPPVSKTSTIMPSAGSIACCYSSFAAAIGSANTAICW